MNTVQTSDAYIKVCLRAWLFCESCIQAETLLEAPNQQLIEGCHRCAHSCLAVITGLINKKEMITDDVFRCLLYCRSCETICEGALRTEEVQNCAEACRNCADHLSEIAWYFGLN